MVPSLGSRGQGWVWLQFVLMALAVAAGLLGPGWESSAVTVAGWALLAAGVAVGAWASRSLGPALTPYPRPASRGALVEHGPYRWVRHPIYSAGLLVFAGVALLTSPVALAPVAALAVVWALKAVVEERFLGSRYAGYAAYRRRVRFRLVPGLF